MVITDLHLSIEADSDTGRLAVRKAIIAVVKDDIRQVDDEFARLLDDPEHDHTDQLFEIALGYIQDSSHVQFKWSQRNG